MRTLVATLVALIFFSAGVHAQTLERIKSSGEIVFGFRTDAAPLSYLSDGSPQGYTPVVCFALAPLIGKQLGLPELNVVFKPVDTENRFEKVANGEIDLLCGAATITLERRELVDFSIPVFVDGTGVALRKDAPETLAGLTGETIGVRADTTTSDALVNTLVARGIEAKIKTFSSHPDGMKALEDGDIEAYFADLSILMNLVLNSDKQDKLKIFQGILTVEKQGLALARGDADFRLAVDRAISELYANRSMLRAFAKTLPSAAPGTAMEAMYLIAPTLP